ncbi:MAG: hypothetical protein WC510_07115 [Candidatus Omnitrophota bacterium]
MRKVILAYVFLFLCVSIAAASTDETRKKIVELKNQIIDLQNQGELGITDLVACSKVLNLGTYVPLPEAKVKKGGTFYTYFEPLNFFTNKREGMYEIWLSADMFILNEAQEVLMSKENATDMHLNTYSPVFDLYFKYTLDMTDAPVGKYVLKVVINDKLRETSAEKTLPFEVVE